MIKSREPADCVKLYLRFFVSPLVSRGPTGQDREPLTKEIAKLPDSSVQAQLQLRLARLKSTNDLDLVEARFLTIHHLSYFLACSYHFTDLFLLLFLSSLVA